MEQEPYLTETKIVIIRKHNPNYDQDEICECGHPYHRHFDWMEDEDNQAVGCKYCNCYTFKPKRDE